MSTPGSSSRRGRDAERAARAAALRRRQLTRFGGLVAAIGVVVAVALLTQGGGGGAGRGDRSEEPAAEAACGAEPPAAADPQQYPQPPEMALRRGVDYRAVVETSCGRIEIDLLEGKAPVTVNNFVFLAREGYFDGLIWHRIERNFVIQTGDPDAEPVQEPNGPGYAIPDELPARAREYRYGTVAMANSGADTGGSQWFIVVKRPPGEPAGSFDPLYAIFGTVDPASYETLESIRKQEVVGSGPQEVASRPVVPIFIESIEILEI